jgi:hypothetical protein
MTMPDPISVADLGLLDRVREAATSDKTLSAAIHDAAGALGIDLPWHEADVLAEAIRGHWECERLAFEIVSPSLALDDVRPGVRRRVLHNLLEQAAETGLGLVAEPVETLHLTSPFHCGPLTDRSSWSPAMTDEEADQASGAGQFRVLVLTGRFRKLAKAT